MTVEAIVRAPSSASKMTTNSVIRSVRLRARGRGNSSRAMCCGDYATEGVTSEEAGACRVLAPAEDEHIAPDGITVIR